MTSLTVGGNYKCSSYFVASFPFSRCLSGHPPPPPPVNAWLPVGVETPIKVPQCGHAICWQHQCISLGRKIPMGQLQLLQYFSIRWRVIPTPDNRTRFYTNPILSPENAFILTLWPPSVLCDKWAYTSTCCHLTAKSSSFENNSTVKWH